MRGPPQVAERCRRGRPPFGAGSQYSSPDHAFTRQTLVQQALPRLGWLWGGVGEAGGQGGTPVDPWYDVGWYYLIPITLEDLMKRLLTVPALLVTAVLPLSTLTASAAPPNPVPALTAAAHPLRSTDADASLSDLKPLAAMVPSGPGRPSMPGRSGRSRSSTPSTSSAKQTPKAMLFRDESMAANTAW
jgi:hypothetical protein